MSHSTIKEKKLKAKQQLATQSIPVWGWLVIGIFIIAGVIWFTMQSSTSETSGIKSEISVEEAERLRGEGAFILDVREQSEWIQFHIPGAKLIPLGKLAEQLGSIPKDKTIVVVCRTGRRSAEGRDILKNAGFKNVTSMAGGVTEWQAKGFPIETGE